MLDNVNDVVWTSLPPVPKGVKPLDHQVAGHIFGRPNGHKKNQLGFLQNDEGQIFKPIQGPVKGKREAKFYEHLFDSNMTIPEFIRLRDFVPKYFGLWTTKEHLGSTYLKLENVTYNYKFPCIMDIKIGPITYDHDADPSKILREKSKSPFLEKIGFQILGIKVFSTEINDYKILDRYFLRTLDENSVLEKGLKVYFNLHEVYSSLLLNAFLKRLLEIQNWFLHQRKLHFVASSLLFVYDALLFNILKSDCKAQEFSSSDPVMQLTLKHLDIRMIDFTHVFEFETNDRMDNNYITGLNSLINYIKLIPFP